MYLAQDSDFLFLYTHRYIMHLQTEDSTTQKDMTQDGPANLDILGTKQEATDAVLDETERKNNGVTTTRV